MNPQSSSSPDLKRVVVVVNKWWEANPVLNVLLNDNCRPDTLGWPTLLHHPCPEHDFFNGPRAVFTLDHIQAEVWCISDLLAVFPEGSAYQSSSERKMEVLPLIFSFPHATPDLVVAVGTSSSYPVDVSVNGSVITGTQVFLHNGHPDGSNPNSDWQGGPFDVTLPSALDPAAFGAITELPPETVDLFLVPPLNPAPEGGVLLRDHGYVDLNTINVTDYKEYDEKDLETLTEYQQQGDTDLGRTVETTLGLVRCAAGDAAPFLFVAGIVNRMGCFATEVDPRSYAQDTTGAHNAGIAVAWMLPAIDAYFGTA